MPKAALAVTRFVHATFILPTKALSLFELHVHHDVSDQCSIAASAGSGSVRQHRFAPKDACTPGFD
jgi:hypothetical protein